MRRVRKYEFFVFSQNGVDTLNTNDVSIKTLWCCTMFVIIGFRPQRRITEAQPDLAVRSE